MREGLSVSVCRHWHQTLCKPIICLWHCGMRHRGGRTVILFRWWNVESRSRNVKGNAESDEQGRNVLKGHTQATGIIQLLNKEEDMMKEAKPFVSDPKVMSMHKELSVKSRVRGDFHARFCERVRVKLPRSTRPMNRVG